MGSLEKLSCFLLDNCDGAAPTGRSLVDFYRQCREDELSGAGNHVEIRELLYLYVFFASSVKVRWPQSRKISLAIGLSHFRHWTIDTPGIDTDCFDTPLQYEGCGLDSKPRLFG